MIDQRKDRFLERVSYITSPGNTVKTLVSNLGVFEKLEKDGVFTLTACLPNPQVSTVESKIKNLKDHCGWDLKISPTVQELPPPTFEELMTLRLIDPDGHFRY